MAYRSIITLTTDFGTGSVYIAEMKGAILSINPNVQLVDISHAISPQDVRQGALIMEQAITSFPPEAIHIGVIDPGVGSKRDILLLKCDRGTFIAPDNGLLSLLASNAKNITIASLTERKYWRNSVSSTFHGRDIMAPVAAHLSLGIPHEAFGQSQKEMVQLGWPEASILPNKIEGEVITIDSFGNLVTNITKEQLQDISDLKDVTVRCDDHETFGVFNTYADQPAMTLIAVIGSQEKLELAIVDENASMMLGVRNGVKVTVSW